MNMQLSRMDIMDLVHGHRTVTWDPNDPAAVSDAEAQFNSLRAQGYSIFRMIALGQTAVTEEIGDKVEEFDPAAGRVMARMDQFDPNVRAATAVPQRQGG